MGEFVRCFKLQNLYYPITVGTSIFKLKYASALALDVFASLRLSLRSESRNCENNDMHDEAINAVNTSFLKSLTTAIVSRIVVQFKNSAVEWLVTYPNG